MASINQHCDLQLQAINSFWESQYTFIYTYKTLPGKKKFNHKLN
jgi:hypothetical protein